MIEDIEGLDKLMLEVFYDKIDDYEEFGTPEYALSHLRNGDWGDYCPCLAKRFRAMIPEEYVRDSRGRKVWTEDCMSYQKEDIDFIKKHVTLDYLPVDILNEIDDYGCRGCWTFAYYYTLAHIVKNEKFWRL